MSLIAGVDEVGRGPLAGPVVAAAVILATPNLIVGLKDSKLLSPSSRASLAKTIQEQAVAWSIGSASEEEIDRLNILQATLLAMQRAIQALSVQPEFIQVDGLHLPAVAYPMEAIVRGDATVPVISAASILAKVTRDDLMLQYDQLYPLYGFAQHKGYGTAAHLAALRQLGASPIHRQSFAPVKYLGNTNRQQAKA